MSSDETVVVTSIQESGVEELAEVSTGVKHADGRK